MQLAMSIEIAVGAYELVYDPSVGEAEPWYINDHTFVRDRDGLWHLIGITHAEPMAPLDELHLAHATAPTVHGPWTKQPFAMSVDPSRGETHLWAPHIVEHADRYWMFYCGGGSDWTRYQINLATSDDCTNWTRHRDNPIVVDGFQARDPMVLWLDDRWVMYYAATLDPAGGPFVVAATESTDLVHWDGRHIVYQDAMSGTMAGPTESPFVVRAGDQFLLLIGPDWDGILRSHDEHGGYDRRCYRRTRVMVSGDPLQFDIANLIATIDSHAAEVVVDIDGSAWVSHCGWGEGGVYLAPFRWQSPVR
jgi:arabinan endo-1,5-alpha-L-arabinosidase